MPAPARWVSDRSREVEVSGIRKVFDLGKSLEDPVNLSIGQPHFPVPGPIREAAKAAIDAGLNGYTVTQGAADLRDKISAELAARFPGQDRPALVTSGTSGGLVLALLAAVNPGDEVIVPDPYFVSYPNLVRLAGGVVVPVGCDPATFAVDPAAVEAAVTPRTKALMLCSPANPTGAVTPADALARIAEVCRARGVLVISDEIYRAFCYDGPARSAAEFDENVLVVEGFGKTYGVTGWRLGYAHGPRAVVEEMTKFQQFTFVCAPSMAQAGAVAAMDYDVSGIVADYRRKRDFLVNALSPHYQLTVPGGAFYLYPRVPAGYASGTAFVTEAIRHNLLIVPGGVFSRHDTHFRVSYAASDETLARGVEILVRMATRD